MEDKKNRVCPVSNAWLLDNPIRKLFQNPDKIVGEFVKSGDRVLDLGCGPGYFTLAMARMVGPAGKVLSVDLQPEMLSIVERKGKKLGLMSRIETHVCKADTLNIPSSTKPFDFALLYYVIHEAPNPESQLSELYSLMKKTGRLLIVEPIFHVKEETFCLMLKTAQNIGYHVEGPSRKKGGWAAILSLQAEQ